VVNELVAGQKLLTENLQKQQKLRAEHIREQQGALKRYQQAISQLTFSTQQWWQCPGGGHGRNQRGGSQNNRKPESKPPALNEKTPRQLAMPWRGIVVAQNL